MYVHTGEQEQCGSDFDVFMFRFFCLLFVGQTLFVVLVPLIHVGCTT